MQCIAYYAHWVHICALHGFCNPILLMPTTPADDEDDDEDDGDIDVDDDEVDDCNGSQ